MKICDEKKEKKNESRIKEDLLINRKWRKINVRRRIVIKLRKDKKRLRGIEESNREKERKTISEIFGAVKEIRRTC